MSITVFNDVVLPSRVIASGVRGKQIRKNSRVTVIGGQESVNVLWSQTLRQFEIGIAPMRREAWQDIETIHEITEGGAYGFLLEDPKDAVVVDGRLDFISGTTYALYKRYTHVISGRTHDRRIMRPMDRDFVVLNTGVAIDPGNLNLATYQGTVDIVGAPAEANLRWTGRFRVAVHFMEDSIDWTMVVPGTDPDARFLAGPSVVLEEIRETYP